MLDFSKENKKYANSGFNKSRKTMNEIYEESGKVPPQAIELEEAVLGALMIEKTAILDVIDIIAPDSFYKESHRLIFKAILKLSEQHQGIDILTVTETLRKAGNLEEVGGAFYISQLTSNIASSAHIEYHARIIAQKHIQRELIRTSSEIQNMAFDPGIDVDDLLDFAEKELYNIASGNIKNEISPIDLVIKQALHQIEEAGKRSDGLSGIPCGFTALDRMTSGWQRSDLIIVAARPSMGKTSFVLSMMRNIAVEHKKSVAMFSLEMSGIQLVNRLIIAETELPSDKIKTGKLEDFEWQQLMYKITALSDAKIYLDDTPAISIFELRAKCRRLKMQYDVDLIIIDYLQLMTGTADTRGNREQEVSTISRGLKAIAKELDIPIIALSQLNRSVEMRSGDKRPQLSDLRESGAIEQDADMVMFIHRPERYGLTEDDAGNSTAGLAEIIIAKHRNGPIGDVRLRFIADQAKFAEFEDNGLEPISFDTGDDEIPAQGGVILRSKMNDDVFTPSTSFDSNVPF